MMHSVLFVWGAVGWAVVTLVLVYWRFTVLVQRKPLGKNSDVTKSMTVMAAGPREVIQV